MNYESVVDALMAIVERVANDPGGEWFNGGASAVREDIEEVLGEQPEDSE